jgi:metal-responsive CopG/Arc/MetJ family transcriptional regulator
MKTVQMTLDDDLIAEVDRIVTQLGSTRSAFTREALRQAIKQIELEEKEQRHREGYTRQPVMPNEFGDWEDEQVWPT